MAMFGESIQASTGRNRSAGVVAIHRILAEGYRVCFRHSKSILKKRFLFLKHPTRIHSPEYIQRAFLTCCVLHNILLDYDRYNTWDEDKVEDSLDYNCLEESAELATIHSAKYGAISGVRAANCEMFGLGGDGEEDPDVNPVDCQKPQEEAT